jgi:ATP-dependent DNA helicase
VPILNRKPRDFFTTSTPAADMHTEAMQDEETRIRAQREKDDAKRDAQLEKERQEDLKSGREVLDKKFQQLEFLMNKSKVRTIILEDAYLE